MNKSTKALRRVLSIVLCLCLTCVSNVKAETINSDEFTKDSNWRQVIENRLVESGASKDDVELISDVDLKRLYNSKSISVDVIYSEVDAVTGEIREVPSDEVDSLLDRLEKEKEANIAKFLNSSNLNNPNDITMSSGYDSETTADGYLQQTIYIAETGTNKVYNVMYTAKWLKEIANTKIDVFGIAVSNAYPIKGTEHSYQQAMYVTASDGKRSSTGYIPLNTTDYFYGSEGNVQKVNFKKDCA